MENNQGSNVEKIFISCELENSQVICRCRSLGLKTRPKATYTEAIHSMISGIKEELQPRIVNKKYQDYIIKM